MREPVSQVWQGFGHALDGTPEALAGEAHVLRLPLPLEPLALRLAASHLSAAEQAQAARYAQEADRERFLAGRIAARTVLSWWTGTPADALVIGKASNGKPFLPQHPQVLFNLSHSGRVVLLAFADAAVAGGALGVDVESVRAVRDMAGVARTAFRPADQAALLARPADEQPDYFFALWTEQEALLKASGEGLSGLHALHQASADRSGWSVHSLLAGPDHPAALALRAPGVRVRLWEADLSLLGPLLASSLRPFPMKDAGALL